MRALAPTVEIEFYGKLADLANMRAMTVSVEVNASINAVIKQLTWDEPALGAALDAETTIYVLNDGVVDRAAVLTTGDKLAFLPPVSGG
ncbi:MAG: MoaD/ThiS family protein [Pseudomonadota bacterium]